LTRKEKQKPDPSSWRKILLVRLRRVGDVVMTTPAITALKEGVPRASLTYVIEEPFRRLVEDNPRLDRVISLPPGQGSVDFLLSALRIRREKYDLVIDFHGGPRAFLLTLLSGARLKAGYRLKYKSLTYDIRVQRGGENGPSHSVEGHLRLLRALGLAVPVPPPPLFLPEARKEEKERADKFWTQNGLRAARVVVLHIGAGNAFRDWGREKLIALADMLTGLDKVRVILAGSEKDRPREQEILAKGRAPLLSLVGRTGLVELREVIKRASLFVGSDSGPMHVAASTSTPIVAFFGPTLPETFAPWRAESVLLEKNLSCRPCKQRRCVSEDFRCLQSIQPAEVYEACLKYLPA
jgi:lipopolysaccharide heptosyltransferase II